jgi:2-keto-3-deoxy-L-fuconate dehydrogenase
VSPTSNGDRALAGQRAIVTGAASGIGRAIAEKLLVAGVEVIAADLHPGDVETGPGSESGRTDVKLDVSDEDEVAAMARSAIAEGPVDLLFNVAGIGSTTSAPDTPMEVFDDVLAVNVRGTFLTCKHLIPGMIEAGGGSILNMGSIAGLVGLRNRAAYCASKGAVIALTKALAIDHVSDGIRVNCVCPGTVDSPWVRGLVEDSGESLEALRSRQPMGRLGTPDEIADAAVFLAGDQASFATGTVFTIDGGMTAA